MHIYFQYDVNESIIFENFPARVGTLNKPTSIGFSPGGRFLCVGQCNGRAALYALSHYNDYWSKSVTIVHRYFLFDFVLKICVHIKLFKIKLSSMIMWYFFHWWKWLYCWSVLFSLLRCMEANLVLCEQFPYCQTSVFYFYLFGIYINIK